MIQRHQDAFGQEMYDYMMGKKVVEIIERDDGFIDVSGGPSAYFADYEEWPRFEQKAISFVQGRILDVGCGAGRQALYLQEKGHEIVGIDNSPLAIEVCKQRGVKDARLLSVTQVGSGLGQFNTIIMMGNNFGLMANARRARWLLRRFYGICSEEGRIVAASNDPYLTDNPDHHAYHARNLKRQRMPGQLRIRVRYRTFKGPWFDYLLLSRTEMQELVKGTGWEVEKFLDSDSSPYVAILRKIS